MHAIDDIDCGGVYFIKNRENGRVYIGCSNDIARRVQRHEQDLRRGEHYTKGLQYDFDTYGADAFDVGVIQEIPPGVDGHRAERAFIRRFNADDPTRLYNTQMVLTNWSTKLIARLAWLELSNN